MEQVEQYVNGEHDYTKIKGGTGPLVYPAAHVYLYWVLYKVTNKGRDILLAQRIFGILYLGTIATVMASYRRAKVRNYKPNRLLNLLIILAGSSVHFPHARTFKTPS